MHIILSLLAGASLALMPPHVTETAPLNGQPMVDNTITFHGYSLEYADKEPTVAETTRKETVVFSKALKCTWVGKGKEPGARQQKCALVLTIDKPFVGARYTATFLGQTVETTFPELKKKR